MKKFILTLMVLTVLLSFSAFISAGKKLIEPASKNGLVHLSMPKISTGVKAFSSQSMYPAFYANDEDYNTDWRSLGNISQSTPAWLCYDLSGIPSSNRNKIIAVWYNTLTFNYDHSYYGDLAYNNISDYKIEANKATGGKSNAPKDGWISLVEVTKNTFHSRQHFLNFEGYNWIRIIISKPDGSPGNNDASLNFDIHDASSTTSDNWLFMGDSITAYSMPVSNRGCNGLLSFSQMINNKTGKTFYPIQEAAGIGGTKTDDALKYIDTYLKNFNGKYVCLSYGTNDVNNKPEGVIKAYNNYESLIRKVLSYGKTPVIPQMPWARTKGVTDNAPALNAKIKELYKKYPQIIKGPDLWTVFYNKPNMFFDELHPNAEGIRAYRQAWADAVYGEVYVGAGGRRSQ